MLLPMINYYVGKYTIQITVWRLSDSFTFTVLYRYREKRMYYNITTDDEWSLFHKTPSREPFNNRLPKLGILCQCSHQSTY